ncbi:MAG TPA: sigma-70 family RNA polymerase sigma factor [Longimicrobiaceae bacterium]|nr:sigma-70 family RNA polymerase sigma factor [Longimicrobiaceae bacterium]
MDFDQTFRSLYPPLFRYVHRLTGDADAAEDVAQESFVRLLGHRVAGDGVRVWLFTVATNLVRDGARKAARRERILAAEPVAPSPLPAPDAGTEHEARITGVREALGRLSARDREMLLMREEGFSYAEIARATGTAPGSVGTLLARALRRFTQAYQTVEPGE